MTGRIAMYVMLVVAVASLLGSCVVLVFSRTTQGSIEAFIWLLLSLFLVLGSLHSLTDGDYR